MKYILSLDGGGIRGIIPATVLMEIEERTGKQIHELFDLVAGTSIGGIIALGLLKKDSSGGAQYTAEDMLKLHTRRGDEIFHRPLSRKITSPWGFSRPKYPHKNMEEVLDDYFGGAKLGDALTNVLINSYDIENREPYFFKSWRPKDSDVYIKKAARATSAAPTFFAPTRVKVRVEEEPGSVGEETFELTGETSIRTLVDGGVFVNNPAVSAFVEAQRIFPYEKKFTVVSIGCGELNRKFPYEKSKNWGILGWIKPNLPLLSCMFDGASDAVTYQLERLIDEDKFFRLQIELTEALDDIDDVSEDNLDDLVREGKRLIRKEYKNTGKSIVDVVVDKLKNK